MVWQFFAAFWHSSAHDIDPPIHNIGPCLITLVPSHNIDPTIHNIGPCLIKLVPSHNIDPTIHNIDPDS
jgi:hypothetical protein